MIGVQLVTVLSGVALASALGLVALLRPDVYRSLRGAAPMAGHVDVSTPEVREIDLGGGTAQRR